MLHFISILHTLKSSRYLSSVPLLDKYGTRPFLRWVRLQSRSPHASGIAKNTFGHTTHLCYLSLVSPPDKCGTRPFLRWSNRRAQPTHIQHCHKYLQPLNSSLVRLLTDSFYISTTSSHVNSSSTIHFNTCVSGLKIRVRTMSRYRYILLHNNSNFRIFLKSLT